MANMAFWASVCALILQEKIDAIGIIVSPFPSPSPMYAWSNAKTIIHYIGALRLYKRIIGHMTYIL